MYIKYIRTPITRRSFYDDDIKFNMLFRFFTLLKKKKNTISSIIHFVMHFYNSASSPFEVIKIIIFYVSSSFDRHRIALEEIFLAIKLDIFLIHTEVKCVLSRYT